MEILIYFLIGLFMTDIIVGLIVGYIDGKREAQIDYKLSCILQALEHNISDDVFPEFKDGDDK